MNISLIVMTSFYPAAQQAVQYADVLAGALGGQVVLLHANRVALFDPYVFAGDSWRKQELEGEKEIETLLERQAEQLWSPASVEIATDLLPDVARDLLARYHPALFVIGRPAPDPTGPEQLSTIVLELLQAAHIPILLVPLGSKALNPAQKVLVAADTEDFKPAGPADAVHLLLGSLGMQGVTVAHVSVLEEDESCAHALQAVKRSGLLEGMPEPSLRGYQSKNPAAGVFEGIRDTQADMVVMMARPRSYLGELFHTSVTVQVMHESPVPVLVVPATNPAEEKKPGQRVQAQDSTPWPGIS